MMHQIRKLHGKILTEKKIIILIILRVVITYKISVLLRKN